MSLRQALGGPWATHWVLWAALFVPTTLLVVLQEFGTGFPTWWWPLVSAVVQHLTAGAIVVGGGEICRRRWPQLPIVLLATLWSTAAFTRGLVGGAFAEVVADAEPEYFSRGLIWFIGSVVWIPVIVYTMAQLDRRRLMIGALDAVHELRDQQRERAGQSAIVVRNRLHTAVRESLKPAIDDLLTSVQSSHGRMSAEAIAQLSMQISALHDRTADLLEPGHPIDIKSRTPRSSVRRAFDVAPRRPWITGLLVALSTVAVLLPDVSAAFGTLAGVELIVSTVAAGLILAVVPWLARLIAPHSTVATSQRISVIATVAAIGVAVYLMLNSGIDPITSHGLQVVPLLAVCLAIASVVFTGATVLADANEVVAADLERLHEQTAQERSAHDDILDSERARLSTLMHGPVQGRLAACVMALNFSATDGLDEEQSAALFDSVRDHLRSASRDLGRIAAEIPAATRDAAAP